MASVKALVESADYLKTARAVLKGTRFRLCKTVYDVEFEIVANELKAASMTLEALEQTLADEACLAFCRRYVMSGKSLAEVARAALDDAASTSLQSFGFQDVSPESKTRSLVTLGITAERVKIFDKIVGGKIFLAL